MFLFHRFKTDESVTLPGFRMTFARATPPPPPPPPAAPPSTGGSIGQIVENLLEHFGIFG